MYTTVLRRFNNNNNNNNNHITIWSDSKQEGSYTCVRPWIIVCYYGYTTKLILALEHKLILPSTMKVHVPEKFGVEKFRNPQEIKTPKKNFIMKICIMVLLRYLKAPNDDPRANEVSSCAI